MMNLLERILTAPRGNYMLNFHGKILSASHGNMNMLDLHERILFVSRQLYARLS